MVNTFLVDFGEAITYTPYKNSPIQILAIINRNPASAIPGFSGSATYSHEILIANDATAGMQVVNSGKDTVTFASKIGGAPEKFIVKDIIEQDQGAWKLGVG